MTGTTFPLKLYPISYVYIRYLLMYLTTEVLSYQTHLLRVISELAQSPAMYNDRAIGMYSGQSNTDSPAPTSPGAP